MINLWPVPEVPDISAGTDRCTSIYFPLFSSTEIHADYVDGICWHGDLILSHSASSAGDDPKSPKCHIILWKIDGFSSDAPVPETPPEAKPGLATRSAFGGHFQRLLTFDMQHTSTFYMRFSLFAGAYHHPILVMGSGRSKFSFWDLQALELDDFDSIDGSLDTDDNGSLIEGHSGERRGLNDDDEDNDAVSFATAAEDNQDSDSEDEDTPSTTTRGDSSRPSRGQTSGRGGRRGRGRLSNMEKSRFWRFDISDPFRPIAPHHTITVPKYNFTVRQCAWSNDGSWCIAACEMGIICMFHRTMLV